MGFFKSLFGSEPQKITIDRLSDLFLNNFTKNVDNYIQKYKELSYKAEINDKDMYLALGALESFCLSRVMFSSDIINKTSEQALNSLNNVFVNKILYSYEDNYDVAIKDEEKMFNELDKIYRRLKNAYNESLNNEDDEHTYHWYVAKEMLKNIFNRENPEQVSEEDLPKLTLLPALSQIVHVNIKTKKEVLDEVFEKYQLVI